MKALGAIDFTSPSRVSGPTSGATGQAGKAAETQSGFGEMLSRALSDGDKSLRLAEQVSVAALTGEVPIQKAVETVLQAEQKVQLTMAVRDKIVAAYLELSRMPI